LVGEATKAREEEHRAQRLVHEALKAVINV
jgi:hypothetical protein